LPGFNGELELDDGDEEHAAARSERLATAPTSARRRQRRIGDRSLINFTASFLSVACTTDLAR
jgi:hypothetical protein